jgi:3-hydroxyisobutyrate dehydrogenase
LKTGFIGLGAMGLPMARNLHHAGLLHAVWSRTAEKSLAFVTETGCRACADPAEVARECDVVVICVSADDDLLDVVDALVPGLTRGALVLDCSTTSADAARTAVERVRRVGAEFLDCPVTGGTEGARQGTLAIMVGGDGRAFERARPVLAAMGRTIVHFGPVGAGQAAKAVNQIMVAGINQAVSEALAFARAEELPIDKLIETLGQGAAGSWFLANRGPNMLRGTYPLGFKVRLHQKDLEICRKMAARFDVRLPLVEMTLLHYKRLLALAEQDEDISSLHRLKAAMFEGDES